MNLINFLESFHPARDAQYGQLRRLFQGVLTSALHPMVTVVTTELPAELAQRLATPQNLSVPPRTAPGWTVNDIINSLGLTEAKTVAWACQELIKAGSGGIVKTIFDPIVPTNPLIGGAFAGWVQIGSPALHGLSLDGLFAEELAKLRASEPQPVPTGPPNVITGPTDHFATQPPKP
jgi:hypothetical protein